MAVQGDRTIGGHLHRAQIDTSFARAYVIPSDRARFKVSSDDDYSSPGSGDSLETWHADLGWQHA